MTLFSWYTSLCISLVTHKPIISCFSDRSTPCAFFHLKVNRLGLVQPSRIERYPLIWRGRLYGEIERAFVNSYSLSVQNITNRCFRHFGWVGRSGDTFGHASRPKRPVRVKKSRFIFWNATFYYEILQNSSDKKREKCKYLFKDKNKSCYYTTNILYSKLI